MNNYGVIYCYTYLPSGEKYIGQTTNIEKRKKEHLIETRTNQRFHNHLRKYYDDFIIEILEDNIPVPLLDAREIYWIKYYNTYEGPGFNLTPGGDGGFKSCLSWWKQHPEEMKTHIAKIQPLAAEAAKQWRINNPELEQKRLDNLHEKSKEWRQSNPEAFFTNLKLAQEKAKEWRENNPEVFQKNREKAIQAASKPVECINTKEIFCSASEAARQKNIPASNISGCCRGVRKSAGKDAEGNKLLWRYVDE